MKKIAKNLYQFMNENVDSYCIKNDKVILLTTLKNLDNIEEELSYDDIFSSFKIRVKQDVDLYLCKYSDLQEEQIQYMKQVFETYNILFKNYNQFQFDKMWGIKKQLVQDSVQIGKYLFNFENEKTIKQTEYYTISEGIQFKEKIDPKANFMECYKIQFNIPVSTFFLFDYSVQKGKNMWYFCEKKYNNLTTIQETAQEAVKKYLEQNNNMKQSSVVRQLLKIANDANQHVQLTLKLHGTSSYMIVPFGKDGMDAEQLVTYILKTEKQLKIGFDQLSEHIEQCRYYSMELHNGQLFAYCSSSVYYIAKAFVENEYYQKMSNNIKLNGIDGDKVKSFVQDLFKECFQNISIKIQDSQIGEIISWAKKILDKRMRQI